MKAENTALRSLFNQVGFPCSYKYFKEVYEIENALLWNSFERGDVTAEEVKVKRFDNTLKKLALYESRGKDFCDLYIEELAKCDFLLEGAFELVQKISGIYKLFFITNGLWDVQRRRIGSSPIFTYFQGLIVSEKVGSAKPDRIIFDEAFKEASYPDKKKVLIIGDSLSSDIKGGALYGIDTCWYNPYRFPLSTELVPTYEVNSFTQLEELLKN